MWIRKEVREVPPVRVRECAGSRSVLDIELCRCSVPIRVRSAVQSQQNERRSYPRGKKRGQRRGARQPIKLWAHRISQESAHNERIRLTDGRLRRQISCACACGLPGGTMNAKDGEGKLSQAQHLRTSICQSLTHEQSATSRYGSECLSLCLASDLDTKRT